MPGDIDHSKVRISRSEREILQQPLQLRPGGIRSCLNREARGLEGLDQPKPIPFSTG